MRSNPYEIKVVKFKDNTGHVRKRITAISDRALNDLCDDSVKLIKKMISDAMSRSERSTGALERSITKVKHKVMDYDIATQGVKYGAPIEYGWHPSTKTGPRSKKEPGYFFIVRGFFGMASRWMHGDKWRD